MVCHGYDLRLPSITLYLTIGQGISGPLKLLAKLTNNKNYNQPIITLTCAIGIWKRATEWIKKSTKNKIVSNIRTGWLKNCGVQILIIYLKAKCHKIIKTAKKFAMLKSFNVHYNNFDMHYKICNSMIILSTLMSGFCKRPKLNVHFSHSTIFHLAVLSPDFSKTLLHILTKQCYKITVQK